MSRRTAESRFTHKVLFLLICVVMLACSAFIVQDAKAAVGLFVRTDGSDANCDGLTDAADPGSGAIPRACAFATLKQAAASAAAGQTITVGAGTFNLTTAADQVVINKTGLTIIGAGSTQTFLQTAAPAGNVFNILANGFTLQNISLEKTDNADQNLIYVGADNVTVQDSVIFGHYVHNSLETSRAFEVTYGIDNLTITGNVIHTIRQPAYINGSLASPTTGTIANNTIYHTKGWVIDGANMTFTNNTWGNGAEANVYDIAILATTDATYYPSILAISAANNNAVIEDQRVSPAVLSRVFVNKNSTETTENGGRLYPYKTIQPSTSRIVTGGVVDVAPGTYDEDVVIGKAATFQGAGIDQTIVRGAIGGATGATFDVDASDVTIEGFTITRLGNTAAQWNDPLNSAGVAIQLVNNVTVRNNKFTGNRTAIDINASNGNQVKNNIIDFNRTGMVFRNQATNNIVEENQVTNNWTVGILWLAASTEDATGTRFFNNNISGNWYTQIENRSLTGGVKDFSGNWLGSTILTTADTNGAEPGYAALIPVEYGGTATPPGNAVSVRGAGFSLMDYTPWLASSTDTNTGKTGFQGSFANLYVDDSPAQTGANGRIQEGIDLVLPGGAVRVFPGTYSETAVNRTLFDGSSPYQFGLFIGQAKAGIMVIGVDALDAPVTDANATFASVQTNATNTFGYSGVFVEADNVTLTGFHWLPNLPEDNKTVEVLGNNFTFQYNFLDIPVGGSVYINDWRFASNTSHVENYTIDHNRFDYGTSVDISSGAGFTGAVSGRKITNNTFNGGQAYWALVSFNSLVPSIGWFTYPVNGAVITGNTFSQGEQWIRVRGNGYDNSTFDWASYWNNNTFDKAVVTGVTPPADVREYTYTSGSYTFDHVRRIGSLIQGEVDHAQAGDTVLVKAGTYTEQVQVSKSILLKGESGALQTTLKAPATLPPASNPASTVLLVSGAGVSAEVTGLTISGPGPGGCGTMGYGIFVRDGANANIHDNRVLDVRDQPFSGCQNGVAIQVGRQTLGTTGSAAITNNTISGFQKNGITVSNTGSSATITGNTVTGAGPTTVIAQNGIQISSGATASITGNTVSGHSYTPGTWVSTGMLLYGADASTSANTLSENQVSLYHIEGSGTHDSNIISATNAGVGASAFWGIVVDAPPPGRLPSVLEDQALIRSTLSKAPALQTVTVSNNDLTGDSNGYGIEADGGYGDLNIDFTARNNFVRNWGYGIVTTQCSSGCGTGVFTKLDVNLNSVTGSASLAALNDGTPVVNGRSNWWGSASGPTHAANPGGTGGAVSDSVTYSPWLCSGTDTQPAITGYQPAATNLCGVATRLVFTTQPGGALINQPLNPQPVVTAQDYEGNLGINFNGLVTMYLGTNPSDGMLSGSVKVSAVNGVATFSGLSINRAGADYTLMAFSDELWTDTAYSTAFNITNPMPVLTSIFQTWVRHGSPAFLLTLYGSDFVYNAEARWNGTPLTVVSNTGSEIIAVVPVALVTDVGTYPVTVFNPGPGGGSSTPQTFSVVNVADVSVSKTDGLGSAKGGEILTYTITVSNSGPDKVVGGTFTDTVPAMLTNVTWTCSASVGSACAASGTGNAVVDAATIEIGGTLTYTITGKLPNSASGVLTNTASFTLPALTLDPTLFDLSSTDTTLLSPNYFIFMPIINK